jgi:hypothetical protein
MYSTVRPPEFLYALCRIPKAKILNRVFFSFFALCLARSYSCVNKKTFSLRICQYSSFHILLSEIGKERFFSKARQIKIIPKNPSKKSKVLKKRCPGFHFFRYTFRNYTLRSVISKFFVDLFYTPIDPVQEQICLLIKIFGRKNLRICKNQLKEIYKCEY